MLITQHAMMKSVPTGVVVYLGSQVTNVKQTLMNASHHLVQMELRVWMR